MELINQNSELKLEYAYPPILISIPTFPILLVLIQILKYQIFSSNKVKIRTEVEKFECSKLLHKYISDFLMRERRGAA